MTDSPRTLPAELLDLPVRGRNLEAPRLGELLSLEPCLVVFLRHFG